VDIIRGTPFLVQIFIVFFIAYIGLDGYPIIIPVIQCQAADSRLLTFSPLAFKEELSRIPQRTEVAVFGLTMGMEDVLAQT
jgi:ABC-type amino acid transport system permease subunit